MPRTRKKTKAAAIMLLLRYDEDTLDLIYGTKDIAAALDKHFFHEVLIRLDNEGVLTEVVSVDVRVVPEPTPYL